MDFTDFLCLYNHATAIYTDYYKTFGLIFSSNLRNPLNQ